MKHRLYGLLVFSLVVLTVMSTSIPIQAAERRGKERLAVLDLEAKHGIEKSFAEALSGVVRDRIHSYGDYQVLSKEDIQAVASREQLLQAMGCDDGSSQCLVDFGRVIDTRFMVAGDISKLGSTYTVSLRMLDTQGESAGVTNRVRESCKCEEDALIGAVEDLAAKLIGKPTLAVKKADEERRKGAEAERQRLAEEKKKLDEAEQQRLVEEKRKAEEEAKKPEVQGAQPTVAEKEKKVSPPVLHSARIKRYSTTQKQ